MGSPGGPPFAAVEEALRRIAEAVARDAGADEVYALAADEVARLLHVPFGLVGRVDRAAGEMVIVGANAADAGPAEVGVRRPLAGSFASRVVEAGAPLRERLRAADPGAGVRGERVAAPILSGGGVWGLVGVASAAGTAVPASAEHDLARFADLLALAIRAGADRAGARRRLRQQEAIAALAAEALRGQPLLALFEAAAEVVATQVGASGATIAELNAERTQFLTVAVSGAAVAGRLGARTPLSPEHSPLGRGQTIVVDDFADDPDRRLLADVFGLHSAVIAPIPGADGPYGVVSALDVHVAAFTDADRGFVTAVANILAAAVHRAATEERIRHDALHDALTGAVSRPLLLDRIGHALERAVDDEHRAAILFVDVDRLQAVNDARGHDAGDALLAAVASRLRGAMRPGDTLGRIGGDDFALVCEDVGSESAALAVAQRLRAAVAEQGDDGATISIGVALCTARDDAEHALRNAHAATHRAKTAGGNAVELFDAELRQRLLDQLELDRGLRRAVVEDELVLHFQPIVRLADMAIESFEALVRWNHPTRGLLPPGRFIAFAEETGMIREIGAFGIRAACAAAASWNARSPDARPVGVTVNVSPRQLEAGDDVLDVVRAALDEWGLDPGQLGLEITESVLLDNTTGVEKLHRLRALGVRVLLDDFGTGYSSLANLRNVPLDVVKLDRAFVAGVGSDARDTAIVAAVLEMTRALGLAAIAEGVERPDAIATLRDLGCPLAQGYCFARPAPLAETSELVRTGATWRAL